MSQEFADRPPQAWVNSAVERRLAELGNSLDRVQGELRDHARRGDRQGDMIERLDERFAGLRKEVEEAKRAVHDDVMTKDDFKPYKNGIVLVLSTVGLAVLGALLRLVVLQK